MWWFLFACAGNIQALYQAERDQVLAAPLTPPANWEPEIRLRMGSAALGTLAEEALDAGLLAWDESIALDNPLGIRCEVKPRIRVQRLELKPTDACEGCLELSAQLKGKARWKAGKLSGKVPVKATLRGTLALRLEPGKQGWSISGRVVDLDKLKLDSTMVGKLDLTRHLSGWTSRALEKTPAIEFGQIGGAQLPIRAMRLESDANAIEILALSEVGGGGTVSRAQLPADLHWQVRVSQRTVLAMMRVIFYTCRKLAFANRQVHDGIVTLEAIMSISPSSAFNGIGKWKI